MGILLILIGIMVISFIIHKIIKKNYNMKCTFGIISNLTLVTIITVFVIILVINIDSYNMKIEYQQDKIKIETAINNPQITGEERASVIDLITKDNSIILSHRFYGNNFFTNIFMPKRIQNLELFDINKIPYSITKINNK